jgi:hypothetical protein
MSTAASKIGKELAAEQMIREHRQWYESAIAEVEKRLAAVEERERKLAEAERSIREKRETIERVIAEVQHA